MSNINGGWYVPPTICRKSSYNALQRKIDGVIEPHLIGEKCAERAPINSFSFLLFYLISVRYLMDLGKIYNVFLNYPLFIVYH